MQDDPETLLARARAAARLRAPLHKGARPRARGALSNPQGRHERLRRSPCPEALEADALEVGAGAAETGGAAEQAPALATTLSEERIGRAISRNTSPDIPFGRSLNPYRGCEHGCIYCYARAGHAHLDLSPGLDFETRLICRPGIVEALRREISAPRYKVAPIALGTMTDIYQPIERRLRLGRQVIELLGAFGHPFMLTTRGALVMRDADLLGALAARNLVHVAITLTTLDERLARALEPRAPAPGTRLRMIRRLSEAGVPVSVSVAPVIPALTDEGIEAVLEAAAEAGARHASWVILRLPGELRMLFAEWLEARLPLRAARVLRRLEEMHGGRIYDPRWGRRMGGTGVHARLIGQRFALAARRLGLDRPLPRLSCDAFRVPGRGRQLSLF